MPKKMIIENGVWYLVESPDSVQVATGKRVASYDDGDARSFGFHQGDCYVADSSDVYHFEIPKMDQYAEYGEIYGFKRQNFTYPGRLWVNKKIISFWIYPPFNKLKKILKDIEKEYKEINGGSINLTQFKLDIPAEYVEFKDADSDSDDSWWGGTEDGSSNGTSYDDVAKKSRSGIGGSEWEGGGYLYAMKNVLKPGFKLKGHGKNWKSKGSSINTQGAEHMKSPAEKKKAIEKMLKTPDGRKKVYKYFADKGNTISKADQRMWRMIAQRMGIKEGMIIESIENVPPELKRLVQKHDPKQIAMGIEVEKEHEKGVTDVVKTSIDILKIALAHLEEDPEYYTHLKAMEDKYANEWKSMHKHLKLGLMMENVSIIKGFTFEEGSGILKEAPHIQVGEKVIDLEFEQGKLQGLKRVLNIVLGNQVTDKYGNKFKLESAQETKLFLRSLAKNSQIKSELK